MIRYRFKEPVTPAHRYLHKARREVVVSLDSDDAELAAALTYEGEPEAVARVERRVYSSTGRQGGFLGERCRPIDLAAAAEEHLQDLEPRLIEGDDILRGVE